MLTGELPEVNPEVARRLGEYGHADFVSYVVWTCERAIERGLLPHTNLGVLSRDDLARLREVTASQGLMLESVNPDLVVHQGSPTKHPAVRMATIDAAGELRIPFTSGILVGIGETENERVAALEALASLARAPRPPAGGDPAELRPASPLLRARGRRDRRRGDRGALDRRRLAARRRAADAGLGERRDARGDEAAGRRVPAADARRRDPDPAEPERLVGRPGRGRGDRPRRALGERRPHLARARVPEPAPGPQAAQGPRLRAHRAPLRLPAVPRARVDRAGGARPGQAQVLELHPAPRLGPAQRARDRSGAGAAGDRAGPRR